VGRLVKALDCWWFQEGSAARLAMIRLIIGTSAFVFLAFRIRPYTNVATTSADLFEPVGPIVFLNGPMAPETFRMILIGSLIASVAFVLGWQFRWTGPLFAGLLILVVSYRNSWSMIYHVDNLLLLHVLVLGLTRSADALSLDALSGRSISERWRGFVAEVRRNVTPMRERDDRHWEYGYPVRLLCAVTVGAYVLAGIAKLAGPLGLGWALGEGLRNQVGFDALRKELLEGGSAPMAYVVFNNMPLATALGVGTVLLELGSVLALIDSRVGRVWAVFTYGMHWGIHAVMGISFWYQLTGLAFVPFLLSEGLIRWGRDESYRWIRALSGTPPRPRIATSRTGETDAGSALIVGVASLVWWFRRQDDPRE
jgi:hypothetical protein